MEPQNLQYIQQGFATKDDDRLLAVCNFRTYSTSHSSFSSIDIGLVATPLNTETTMFIFSSAYGLIIEVLYSLLNRSHDMLHFFHLL